MMAFKLNKASSVILATCILLLFCNIARASTTESFYPSETCPDTLCKSPPNGITCQPEYNNGEDACCPKWKCDNGQTFYGSHSSSSKVNPNNWSWKSNWKSSWSSGDSGNKIPLFYRDVYENPYMLPPMYRYWLRR